MDTDVVKLYPFLKINNEPKQPTQMCFIICQLFDVDLLAAFWSLFLRMFSNAATS